MTNDNIPTAIKELLEKYTNNMSFNKEACIKEYMDTYNVNIDVATNTIDSYYYDKYVIVNVTKDHYVNNKGYLLKMIFSVFFCYYITFEYITTDLNSFTPVIIAASIYLLVTALSFILKFRKTYINIGMPIIEKFIHNSQFDIDACVNKYLQYNKEANEEEVRKKILQVYKENFILVNRGSYRLSSEINSTNNIETTTNNGSLFSPNVTRKFACPRCGSTNICLIDDAPGGYKHVSYGPMISRDIDDHFRYGYGYFTTDTQKRKKKVFSKRKAIAAVLTGGASIAFTGLRSKVSSQWACLDCGKTFYRK